MQTGKALFEEARLEDVSQEDLVRLREMGVKGCEVKPSMVLPEGNEAEKIISPEDFEIMEREVAARIRKAVLVRLSRLAEQSKQQNSKLHFLVVYLEEESWIPEDELQAENQKLLMRVIGTGEFGFSTTMYLAGYGTSREALQALGDFSDRLNQGEVLLLNEDPQDFLPSYQTACEQEAVLASVDDSGLAGM